MPTYRCDRPDEVYDSPERILIEPGDPVYALYQLDVEFIDRT